ncbi:hypothetical protein [Streptomyces erythrochromogenes]|uniref:hypothetical protein n=1 Tax=Streptomyces erythrochromogenes TaxID=285574 RepID=UPI00381FA3C8
MVVTVRTGEKSASVTSQAFTGGKQFDPVKFSTEACGTPDVKPTPTPTPQPTKPPQPHPRPLKPSEHKKPEGSVNTGQAPAGIPAGTPADSLSEPGRA